MRKLFFIIIALIVNVPFNSYSYVYDEISISIKQFDNDYDEKPEKGHRTSPTYETCVIDFTNLAIATERIPMIISYELWDETGENIVAAYPDDYDMVVYMSSLTGCYQLRLATAESTYIGYIEL